MKRALSVLMSVILLFGSVAYCFEAVAAESTVALENPLYAERPMLLGTEAASPTQASEQKTYNSTNYSSEGKQLYTSYKKQLLQRKAVCKLRYLSKKKISGYFQKMALLNELFFGATDEALATGCTDGDYLRWAVKGYALTDIALRTSSGGYYYYDLEFQLAYYDTAAQEQQVDAEVNRFLGTVNTNELSDYAVMKKVHDYLCAKTTYATDIVAKGNYADYPYIFSPYGALVKGKCVCQGYAASFYRICKELGYSVRFVSSDPNRGRHAWNLVQLDGKYYFVDCTWDDEIRDGKSDLSLAENYFFLVDYATLQSYDNGNAFHQLDADYYETDYFNEKYRVYFAEENYDRDGTDGFSKATVRLPSRTYGYDGSAKTPAVTVTDATGTVLAQDTDYTVTYAGNTNTGCARVSIRGINAYEGKTTQRLFYILPSAGSTPRVKVSGTAVTLTWNAMAGGVTGYRIEQYQDGKWVYAGATNGTEFRTELPAANRRYFRVRAYKDVSKRRFFGAGGVGVIACTAPDRATAVKLSSKKRRLTFKWKKQACTGYEIQYGVNKNMKGAKTVKAAASKASFLTPKLKKGKVYYFRIRAYKTFKVNGKTKTLYGNWSAKKAVKCK